MNAKALTPILNVSSYADSIAWFEKLGWKESWHWTEPPHFGGVCSGECEIFLCEGAQGGRGRSPIKETFGEGGDTRADKGCWISMWVDDVDAIHEQCLANGIEVAFPPTDMEWSVREMHVRHPDGHVFRIGRHLPED